MTPVQMIVFAVMQGITELFPISSLGHSVLVPAVLNWHINRDGAEFLPFVVVLHLGTATALFLYFWRDWFALLGDTVAARGRPANPNARLFWLLVIGSIPAGLLGLTLEKKLRLLFGGYTVVAVFLAINGIVLLIGDALKRRRAAHTLEDMGWKKALAIGFAQALALIPGMSRSGLTLVAGLGCSLDYAASARFSFLLATPIIAAAGLLEVPKLLHIHDARDLPMVFAAGLIAGVFAYASTWILMRWFKGHEIKALRPFAYYCLAAGLGALAWHLA